MRTEMPQVLKPITSTNVPEWAKLPRSAESEKQPEAGR